MVSCDAVTLAPPEGLVPLPRVPLLCWLRFLMTVGGRWQRATRAQLPQKAAASASVLSAARACLQKRPRSKPRAGVRKDPACYQSQRPRPRARCVLQAKLCPRCSEPNAQPASGGVRAELIPLRKSPLVISEGISVPQCHFWALWPCGLGPGIHTRAWDLEGTKVFAALSPCAWCQGCGT